VPSSTTFRGGDYVCIAVTDKGSGMSEEVLQRAVEPFFSTKDRDASSGLGLSMVYGFVTQSGGHLQIDSKPNKGTDVRIYLPRAMPSKDAHAATTTSLEIPRGTETIMVVDDNQDVRDSASALLRSLGYTVVAANHGRSALHLLQTERIQLLFSDVMMPQLAGFELANVARQFQPRIRVLLTTGYTGSSESPMDETFGGFDVLRKPYTKRDLAIRIRHQLDD
jgi:CheY-like chemotaxis protein